MVVKALQYDAAVASNNALVVIIIIVVVCLGAGWLYSLCMVTSAEQEGFVVIDVRR